MHVDLEAHVLKLVDAFFEQIAVGLLHAKALVEGFNFGFGKDRQGTIDVLRELCSEQGLKLTLIPPRQVQGVAVSSSRVRSELLAGRVDLVAEMLGRPYRINGMVGTGQKRGASLGFPTANLHSVKTLLPGNGVYAVRVLLEGTTWLGAANVGPNPTFGENERKVEVHLIGFKGDLYGQTLSVDFVRKIRDTKPFASVRELSAQIKRDIDAARK